MHGQGRVNAFLHQVIDIENKSDSLLKNEQVASEQREILKSISSFCKKWQAMPGQEHSKHMYRALRETVAQIKRCQSSFEGVPSVKAVIDDFETFAEHCYSNQKRSKAKVKAKEKTVLSFQLPEEKQSPSEKALSSSFSWAKFSRRETVRDADLPSPGRTPRAIAHTGNKAQSFRVGKLQPWGTKEPTSLPLFSAMALKPLHQGVMPPREDTLDSARAVTTARNEENLPEPGRTPRGLLKPMPRRLGEKELEALFHSGR